MRRNGDPAPSPTHQDRYSPLTPLTHGFFGSLQKCEGYTLAVVFYSQVGNLLVKDWSRAVFKEGGIHAVQYVLSTYSYFAGNITFDFQQNLFVGQGSAKGCIYDFFGQGLVKGLFFLICWSEVGQERQKKNERGVGQVMVKEEAKMHVAQVLVKNTKKEGVFGIC